MVRTAEKYKVKSEPRVKSRDERKVGKSSIIRKRRADDEDEQPRRKAKDDKPVKKGKSKSKPEPEKTKKVGEYGADRDHDIQWCDKKVILFKTLKQLDALSPKRAVMARDIVNRSNERLSPRDVRHYAYHAGAMKDHNGDERREPLIAIANPDDTNGYLFYLTKSGAKLDPNEAYRKQEATKSKD